MQSTKNTELTGFKVKSLRIALFFGVAERVLQVKTVKQFQYKIFLKFALINLKSEEEN
jgi:hypothetical protein